MVKDVALVPTLAIELMATELLGTDSTLFMVGAVLILTTDVGLFAKDGVLALTTFEKRGR